MSNFAFFVSYPSSSSSWLLWVLIPLTVITGFLCIIDPKTPPGYSLSPLTSWSFRGIWFSSSIAKFRESYSSLQHRQDKPLNGITESLHLPPLILENRTQTRENHTEDEDKTEHSTEVYSTIPKLKNESKIYSKLGKPEADLAKARSIIRKASHRRNISSTLPDPGYVPQGPSYRNAQEFHRSYLEMEKMFKIYVYEEGEPPLFHSGPTQNIYSTEGMFIHAIEKDTHFRTRDPHKAHVLFLPFSVTNMAHFIWRPYSYAIRDTVRDYVRVISHKHPYWNRSLGADHFFLSCHDWAPDASRVVPNLYNHAIRVLCNANISEGFNPSKDVSLPEMSLPYGGQLKIGGPRPSRRPILAFFAGALHGPIRPILVNHWKGKDNDVLVFENLPKNYAVSYSDMMRRSKYCLCPSGSEVASPRIVEAMYAECVPVTISNNYTLPFSDVLDWSTFSVSVSVSDIPNIKKILMGIPLRRYLKLQRMVKQVQRHFVINGPPQRYDMFHMVLHSVWLRRLNVKIQD